MVANLSPINTPGNKMTNYAQQFFQPKPMLASSGIQNHGDSAMSIICTGPVIPSIVCHHHHYMYYFTNNTSNTSNCALAGYPQTVTSPVILPSPSNMNNLMSGVINKHQANIGTVITPRISVPVSVPVGVNYTSNGLLLEPAVGRLYNSQFVNQIKPCLPLSESEKLNKEPLLKSSFFSSVSSPSACSSSCFAKFSSPSLSPSSSSVSSSPSASPSSSTTPQSSSTISKKSDSSKSEAASEGEEVLHCTAKSATLESQPLTKLSEPSSGQCIAQSPLGQMSTNQSQLSGSILSPSAVPFMPATLVPAPTGDSPLSNLSTDFTGQPTLFDVSLRDYYARLGVQYTPVPWNQSYGMERVWMSEFRRIFSSFYNELWLIQPVERKPTGVKLHMFVDSAKVRFCCDRCGHSWTSMKGRIVFWFNLLQPNFNTGLVAIKLFGQKCEMCKMEIYEQPMWYPEEVTKVLMNLFNRVGQIFYGFEKTKFEKQRRMGKPRTPHNKFLCQACLEGICLSRRSGRACLSTTANMQTESRLTQKEALESVENCSIESLQCQSKEMRPTSPDETAEKQPKVVGEEEDEGHCSEDSGMESIECEPDQTGKSKESVNRQVVNKKNTNI